MSDEIANSKDQVKAEIRIQMMTNGQIMVNGPLNNKMLMYGMLKCAEDAVRECNQKQEQPLIAPVTLVPKFGN